MVFDNFFNDFSSRKMFFQVIRAYIDAKVHGESISDGFRAIRQRKVGEKLKKPGKNRQTRFSGQPSPKSLSNYPAHHCSLDGRNHFSRGIFLPAESCLLDQNSSQKYFIKTLAKREPSSAMWVSVDTPYTTSIAVLAVMKVHKKRDTSPV